MDGMENTVLETTENLASAVLDLVGAGYKVNSEKIKNRADVCLAEMKASSMDLVLKDRSLEVTDVAAIVITIETKQAPPLPQLFPMEWVEAQDPRSSGSDDLLYDIQSVFNAMVYKFKRM
ncbi:hypothetical protein QR680_013797 [Steinernema hermaphroditum]|uniref:Uncharacterized protein n=1 Tax=Steinernema hermaphroditum TaxID=289476 RepID=A0AA39M350_9BILA|nr:hypothetical protein QR680_013797 [Steinernema hermaphroditum]